LFNTELRLSILFRLPILFELRLSILFLSYDCRFLSVDFRFLFRVSVDFCCRLCDFVHTTVDFVCELLLTILLELRLSIAFLRLSIILKIRVSKTEEFTQLHRLCPYSSPRCGQCLRPETSNSDQQWPRKRGRPLRELEARAMATQVTTAALMTSVPRPWPRVKATERSKAKTTQPRRVASAAG